MDDIVVQVGVLPYRGEMAPGLCRGGSIRGAVSGAFFSNEMLQGFMGKPGAGFGERTAAEKQRQRFDWLLWQVAWSRTVGGSAEDCDSDESTSQRGNATLTECTSHIASIWGRTRRRRSHVGALVRVAKQTLQLRILEVGQVMKGERRANGALGTARQPMAGEPMARVLVGWEGLAKVRRSGGQQKKRP
jgi:hypothetical protein